MTNKSVVANWQDVWNASDEQERDLLLYLLYLQPPASLDDLSILAGMPAVRILHLMEGLRRRKVVCEKKEYGRGFYFFTDREAALEAEGNVPDGEVRRALHAVFEFYNKSLKDGSEKTLVLAELYSKTEKGSPEGMRCVHEAMNILYASGGYEKTARYCEYLLNHLADSDGQLRASAILQSITAKVEGVTPSLPTEKQIPLLAMTVEALKRHDLWKDAVRTQLLLGRALGNKGDQAGKAHVLDEAWRIAENLGDQSILGFAALALSDSLFLEGRFADAIGRYEKVVGKLEEFGDDEESLRAAASLGRCYVVCGRISRGLGMIDAAKTKALALSMSAVSAYCDLMSVLSLVEVRRLDEAESRLEKLLAGCDVETHSELLPAVYGCMAFLSAVKGDFERSSEYRRKMVATKKGPNCLPPRGSHVIEFLDELEKRGYFDDSISVEGEITRILSRDDVYMKGIAYRHRALHNRRVLQSMGRTFLDLKNSEKYLTIAGAEIEIARTRIALGDAYLREGGMKAALAYLNQAWSVLSEINESLFPKDLRVVLMPDEDRTELMIERIVNISESVGMRQDMPVFLEKVINAVMDFAMANRGAIFVIEDDVPKIVASRNLDPLLLKGDQFKVVQEVVSEVARSGKETTLPGSDTKSAELEQILKTACIESIVCMPAQLAGQTYAYLYLDSHVNGQVLAESRLPYIRLLCNQIAVGFSTMALFEKLRELKDRFEEEASFYKREMGLSNPEKTIIGQSEAIRGVIEQIRQVAPTDSSVLITGETGVGKELVAMAIHDGSRRKDGPFIPVNLAALPQELVASELFGHEKGAFTGANERYKGRFELANGGTIFLDEIGDLPPSIQVKLLRVLQEGVFERLGSAEPVRSDFRVIAATNKDLADEVARSSFRQDLYYRLNAFPIHVPPLRARKEDIILLAKYFADRFGKKTGKWIARIPLAELRKLLPYEWPGNVRELKHFIERSVILSEGADLILAPPAQGNDKAVAEDHTVIAPLADMERRYIERALATTRWKVSGADGAAALLRIKPTTLLSKMKKLGVNRRPKASA